MSERTLRSTIVFRRPFRLRAVAGTLPPGSYAVETVEALIEGLSVDAYRRVATMLFLPAPATPADASQIIEIDPADLAEAQRRDALEKAPTA